MNPYNINDEDDNFEKESHNGCTKNAIWIFIFIIVWQLANAYHWWGF